MNEDLETLALQVIVVHDSTKPKIFGLLESRLSAFSDELPDVTMLECDLQGHPLTPRPPSSAATKDVQTWLVGGSKSMSIDLLRSVSPSHILVTHAGLQPALMQMVSDETLNSSIKLFNIHHNTGSTAEVGLMLLLALSRRLIVAERRARVGDWGFRKQATLVGTGCRCVYNSTVLVFGYGSVGSHLGKTLASMGTKVVGFKRSASDKGDMIDGVEVYGPTRLDEFLKVANAVVITAPLTPETRCIFNKQRLAELSNNAMIVNIGRAEVVDEHAIWEEVQSGRLGYAADVWWSEQHLTGFVPPRDEEFYGSRYPFHTKDNVVITPHMGGGIGLAGIEEERADALANTIVDVVLNGKKPCSLELGY